GAVSDMREARVGVRAEWALMDTALPRAIENGAPAFELQDSVRRFLGGELGHAPVVDELAAFDRVREMDLPRVLVRNVVHRRGHTALSHDRVRLAEQRLANDQHAGPAFGGRYRSTQAGATRAENEHIRLDSLVLEAHATHRGSCRTPASRRRM